MSKYSGYSEHDLMRLAKRVNNPKRSYLLVNPLQGKHIPVIPDEAITMTRALGETIKANSPGIPVVIGFAETATAIGAAIASEYGKQCFYIHTTREPDKNVQRWIYFSEEHSHATEQKLCADGLEERIKCSDYVLLVDDEISTGKTILNTVSAIRDACPAANQKEFVVASIINRVDESHLPEFTKQKISFVYLLHLDVENYEETVKNLIVQEAKLPQVGLSDEATKEIVHLSTALPVPRRGVLMDQYTAACKRASSEILERIACCKGDRILVLGTEEFMYPALLLAQELNKTGRPKSVKFHATTRSPIGICDEKNYPITNGIRIRSIYSEERITYLYDLDTYDKVIVFTDAQEASPKAIRDLTQGLLEKQCGRIWFVIGDKHV